MVRECDYEMLSYYGKAKLIVDTSLPVSNSLPVSDW